MTTESWQLSEEQIQVASKWWREKLERPKFDNGDQSNTGAMCSILASLASAKQAPTQEQLDAFEQNLKEEMQSYRQLVCPWLTYQVDYGPDPHLSKAAASAGITDNLCAFPWKTNMDIWPDRIEVKCGYGAPWETIWTKKTT